MSLETIQQAIADVREFLAANPEEAQGPGRPVTATYVDGLQMRVDGANRTIMTDMPADYGGGGSAPTPGWFLQAGLAGCDATLIAMRAAEEGISITALEVTIESMWDERGLFGMGESIPPGPLNLHTRIRICAENASHEELYRIVEEALARSPVADTIRRAVPTSHEIVVE